MYLTQLSSVASRFKFVSIVLRFNPWLTRFRVARYRAFGVRVKVMRGQRHLIATLTWGRNPVPLKNSLSGSRVCSVHFGEQKIVLLPPGIEPKFVINPIATVIIPTMLTLQSMLFRTRTKICSLMFFLTIYYQFPMGLALVYNHPLYIYIKS